MRVFHQLDQAAEFISRNPAGASAVAIGNFDGVHLGHAALLGGMIRLARERGLVATVLTFYPHPVEVLGPGKRLERLTTTSEKLELLESIGVDLVLVEKFDLALASLSAKDFFDRYLVHGLRARGAHVGFDFRFGQGRSGDTRVLSELAQQRGDIQIQVEPPLSKDGVKISSSAIRLAIREGSVEDAATLLGRPYFVSGQVVRGDARGRQLGFPTANLRVPLDKLLPRNGVYLTRALWQQQTFRAVTNIGLRPTFVEGGADRPSVEAHLLDFEAPLYEEMVRLEFVGRIRDEQKFASIDALKAQIQADIDYARRSL